MKDDTLLPIVFTIALSIGIALSAYFLLIHFMVDDYPQSMPHYYRVNNLLNFYEQRHDGDIFILGSSYVTEGIDAYVIEDLLHEKLINRSVYNLGIHGDNVVERVGQVDYIIESKSKIVVIGLSYQYLSNTSKILNDHVVLQYQRKQINIEEFHSFFSNEQLTLISQNSLEYHFNYFFDKRKYIYGNAELRIRDLLLIENTSNGVSKPKRFPDLYLTNFKDPWHYTTNLTDEEKTDEALKLGIDRNLISEDLTPQKKALLYMIRMFKQNNTSVIIINMPINPMESDTINESSRHNLSNFLNSTGVPWYDYERKYPSEYFSDMHHMNSAGRSDFSLELGQIIADNLIKGT